MQGLRVGVVGAAGMVGTRMLHVMEERNFPIRELRLLATSRSAGSRLKFKGEELLVRETRIEEVRDLDLVLLATPTAVSRELAPAAVKAGAVVVDESSAFRMDPTVPLVVPEVNPDAVDGHQGILAGPNCSTIQMVVALQPLHQAATIERVIVSTYQSVSGTGFAATEELRHQSPAVLEGRDVTPEVYPWQIAFNLLPHIDSFEPDGYTREEMKMVNETRKIMNAPGMKISATTVRVPVFICHAESILVETKQKLAIGEVRRLLAAAPGVVVVDEPENRQYPLPTMAAGRDGVFVGRIREDLSHPQGLWLWVVADNLRKGAATNAVQIAELLVKKGLV